MNAPTSVPVSKNLVKEVKQAATKEHSSEKTTKSVSTFSRLLANMSNKLGLSKAIYQK